MDVVAETATVNANTTEVGSAASNKQAADLPLNSSDAMMLVYLQADINMDMFLSLFPLHYLEVQGFGESTLGNDIWAAAQLNDIEVQFDKQPDENRFMRSDQASFIAYGIPTLAFKFGWLPDSPKQKTFTTS